MKMNRKEFFKTVALGGLATTLSAVGDISVLAQEGAKDGKAVDFVALLGGEPAPMFEKGMAALGGIERFVSKGDKVTIKPNIGWDKTPELAGNTNPELIVALINACKDCGAKEITVFDHTCDEWRRCYEHSGIEAAAKKAGAIVVPANEEKYYREHSFPNGVAIKKALVHQAILDCDKWFNVPVLKNHGGARMTIAMKNLLGIVWDRSRQNPWDICFSHAEAYYREHGNLLVPVRYISPNGIRLGSWIASQRMIRNGKQMPTRQGRESTGVNR